MDTPPPTPRQAEGIALNFIYWLHLRDWIIAESGEDHWGTVVLDMTPAELAEQYAAFYRAHLPVDASAT